MPEIVTYLRHGQEASPFSLAISKVFGKKLFAFELGSFADTESFLNFHQKEEVAQKEILLIWQLEFSQGSSINSQFLELLFTIKSLKKMGVSQVNVFLPYLPYSRQDKSGVGLEVGLMEDAANLIKLSGANKIISVELHGRAKELAAEINLNKFWAEHISLFGLENTVLASPDAGGKQRVFAVAKIWGVEAVYMEKKRVGTDATKVLELHGDVTNKKVVLLDDILDTAGTALGACNMLINNGAKEVIGCFVHGVFSGAAKQELEEGSFKKIFVTNTVLSAIKAESEKINILDVSDFCIDFIRDFLD